MALVRRTIAKGYFSSNPTNCMLKVITVINWTAILGLGIIVLIGILSPSRPGDAATKGLGESFLYLGIAALVVLIILNVLPYSWSRIGALLIILLPFGLFALNSLRSTAMKWKPTVPAGHQADGAPYFTHAGRQEMAVAIEKGQPDKLKALLTSHESSVFDPEPDGLTLVTFAVMDAAYTSYRPEEKVRCVELLLEAGATLPDEEEPLIIAPATTGHASLVNVLLKYGADPNARNRMGRPALFEAVSGYKDPNETVRLLLEAGADPNASNTDADGYSNSALLQAAAFSRWNICRQLIEKGAVIADTTSEGKTLATFIEAEKPYFQGDSYSTRQDLEALIALLK